MNPDTHIDAYVLFTIVAWVVVTALIPLLLPPRTKDSK